MRILCLHGYHGTAEVLRDQMRSLVHGLEPVADFVYVDAPSLATGDFGWWHHNFAGWKRTRDWIASLFQREPRFDGVFGFSQGAALTSLLVGLRAPDGQVSADKPLSFDFAVMVGGFRSDSADHAHLYAAKDNYTLPSLHIIGQADRIVPAQDSRILAAQFASPTVLEHTAGHVIPGTPQVRRGFADFLDQQVQQHSGQK